MSKYVAPSLLLLQLRLLRVDRAREDSVIPSFPPALHTACPAAIMASAAATSSARRPLRRAAASPFGSQSRAC